MWNTPPAAMTESATCDLLNRAVATETSPPELSRVRCSKERDGASGSRRVKDGDHHQERETQR